MLKKVRQERAWVIVDRARRGTRKGEFTEQSDHMARVREELRGTWHSRSLLTQGGGCHARNRKNLGAGG